MEVEVDLGMVVVCADALRRPGETLGRPVVSMAFIDPVSIARFMSARASAFCQAACKARRSVAGR